MAESLRRTLSDSALQRTPRPLFLYWRGQASQLCLLPTQPDAEDEPDRSHRHGNHRDSRESESERGESCICPGRALIGAAIDEGFDEGLGLVLVLPPHDGEQRILR